MKVRFAGLGEVGKDFKAVADIDNHEKRRGRLGKGKATDVAFGLAMRFYHGIIGAGATNRLVGFAQLDRSGISQFRGGCFGGLKLFGFEDETTAFVEIDAPSGGGNVGMMLGDVEFK